MVISFFGTALLDIVLMEHSEILEHESLFASKYHLVYPGGKAVNQAACAAIFGAKSKILARIGSDESGNLIRIELEKKGVITDFLQLDYALPTGFVVLAPVNTDFKSILVSYASSLKVSNHEFKKAQNDFLDCKLVVGGLELNLNLVKSIFELARKRERITIIDPYPPEKADTEVLLLADIITPNRDEGSVISGRDIKSIFSAKLATLELLKFGIKNVCLKLGADGVVLGTQGEVIHIPPVKVQAVDTTGGGDVFAGVLSVLISMGYSLIDSVKIANYASALSVTRKGAFASIPTPRELFEFMLHRGAEDDLLKIVNGLIRRQEGKV